MLELDQSKPIDAVGIGNAILDVLAYMSDEFIHEQGMHKGDMALIDEDRAQKLYDLMGQTQEVSGGSVANSMAGLAGLGGSAAFIGRVKDDQFGKIYRHDLRSIGVQYDIPPITEGPATGCSYIMVTPDGERTMNTYLGAGAFIAPDDIDEALVAQSKVVFCEGYQWNGEQNIAAIRRACEIAKANGTKVAFSLSAVFCVEAHREAFQAFVSESVDILFANEAEAQSLFPGESIEQIVQRFDASTKLTALTLGEQGSKLISCGQTVNVAPLPVAKVTDATGAGDLYAAGLLYGLTQGMGLAEAGALASACAAQIIQQLGARAMQPLKQLVA